MPQPLQGIKIADFSHVMAGPFCSHFLRMLGAEVVKVESFSGDAMRTYGPFREFDGVAPAFIAANVGKKSLAVDLKSSEGLSVARRLIAASDVVLENFRPGVMSRLGLGYDESKLLRPKLIWCAVSGYGQSGPLRDYPAIDNIVQAAAGMMASNGGPDDPPSRVGWPVVDTYTGTLAALAVLAALLQRDRFGEGQYIDVSMLDASVVMLTSLVTPFLVTGQMVPRTGDTGYSGAPTAGMFLAGDGSRISLGAVQNNQYRNLCRVLGRDDLAADARFRSPELRAQPDHAASLRAVLIEAFAQHDGEYWEANLSAEGVPCGLVRDVRQVCERIAGFDRDLILPTTVPGRPPDKSAAHFVNAGFKFAHDGPGAAGAAPLLGEHSVEVLQTLGYSEHEIGALIEGHAVAARSTAPC